MSGMRSRTNDIHRQYCFTNAHTCSVRLCGIFWVVVSKQNKVCYDSWRGRPLKLCSLMTRMCVSVRHSMCHTAVVAVPNIERKFARLTE